MKGCVQPLIHINLYVITFNIVFNICTRHRSLPLSLSFALITFFFFLSFQLLNFGLCIDLAINICIKCTYTVCTFTSIINIDINISIMWWWWSNEKHQIESPLTNYWNPLEMATNITVFFLFFVVSKNRFNFPQQNYQFFGWTVYFIILVYKCDHSCNLLFLFFQIYCWFWFLLQCNLNYVSLLLFDEILNKKSKFWFNILFIGPDLLNVEYLIYRKILYF